MLGFFDGDFFFIEREGNKFSSFFKGNRNFPWRGGFFLGGPRGRLPPEIPLGKGQRSARGLGGIPISPLKSPRAPHNPLETATVGARRPRRGATPDNPIKKYKHSFPD